MRNSNIGRFCSLHRAYFLNHSISQHNGSSKVFKILFKGKMNSMNPWNSSLPGKAWWTSPLPHLHLLTKALHSGKNITTVEEKFLFLLSPIIFMVQVAHQRKSKNEGSLRTSSLPTPGLLSTLPCSPGNIKIFTMFFETCGFSKGHCVCHMPLKINGWSSSLPVSWIPKDPARKEVLGQFLRDGKADKLGIYWTLKQFGEWSHFPMGGETNFSGPLYPKTTGSW